MKKILIFVLSITVFTVRGQEKVALVVGNNNYREYPLKNAGNDAALMTITLKKLGFTVEQVLDASKTAFEKQLISFNRKYKNADVRFFYYAGHGVQLDGENYLVPVDASLEEKEDIKLEGIDFSTIFSVFQESKPDAMNIFIMDACRNNPFKNRSWGTRGGDSRGLMLKKTDFVAGSFAAFSADNGQKASDGEGANGLYTKVLADALLQPGVEINILFQRVRNKVIQQSHGDQTPIEENRLVSDKGFYFLPASNNIPEPAQPFKKYYYYVDQLGHTSDQHFAEEADAASYMKSHQLYGKVYSNAGEAFLVEEIVVPVKPLVDNSTPNKKLGKNDRDAAQDFLNRGIAQYRDQNYEQAFDSFDHYRQILPNDTTAIYYTGLAASLAKRYDAAIQNYTVLLNTAFSRKSSIYFDLSNIYLIKQDTASCLKTLADGIAKSAGKGEMRKRQIEVYLKQSKFSDADATLEVALNNDPQDKVLYYYKGLIASNAADELAARLKRVVSVAEKNELDKMRSDKLARARDYYSKALRIDPDYFEANLNMGYILISPAIETFNAANLLPASKQKEYDVAMAKASVQFDVAKTYLERALVINPKSADALTNMKVYYLGKHNKSSANDIQKRLDALTQ